MLIFQRLSACIYIVVVAFGHAQFAYSCDSRVSRYNEECKIQDRYTQLKADFKSRNIDIQDITEYRALRFIARRDWDAAKGRKGLFTNPWNVYSPKPATWLYWERGARFVSEWKKDQFSLDDIKNLHRAVIDVSLMSKWATVFKNAGPGKIRSGYFQLPPSFTASCEKKQIHLNQERLLDHFDILNRFGFPMIRTTLYPCSELYTHVGVPKNGQTAKLYPGSPYFTGEVYYPPSFYVPGEIKLWLEQLNNFLINESDSNSSNLDAFISPIDNIADIQRHFISIHPFGDGNGRVSRLIQDYLMGQLGLPYPDSGDLQEDLTTPTNEYRKKMKLATLRSLDFLDRCNLYYKQTLTDIPPECLPITPISIWDHDSERMADKQKFMIQLESFLESKPIIF